MQTQKEAVEQQVMVPISPTAITTPTGLVMVWGFEHVSTKMLDVLKTMLSHDAFENVYHGIKSVVFRVDGYPKINGKNICASFSPDVSGISINLEKTLERAIDRSMDHPETSLLASWWLEMLFNFGHELHHGVRWNTDCNKLHNNEKTLADEEDRAEKYSGTLIIELAQEYDIEMPGIEEETWFNSQIIELLTDKTDEWAKSQREMLTEGIVWRHEPKDSEAIILHTFKDLVCLIADGDADAEEWNKATIELKPNSPTLDEQLNGKKVTINADGEQGEVVQPVAAVTAIDTSCVYVDDAEDYSGIYEEDEGEHVDGEYADYKETPIPITTQPPASLVTPADAAQPAINYANFVSNQTEIQPLAEAQLDMATVNRIAQGVYMKMYDFIFTNCGQQKDASLDISFTNPEAVLTTYLPLTEEERSIIVTMNHLDTNGRWCPNASTKDGLLGKVMKNAKLPAYEIAINVNGTIHRRIFIPQNHNKRENGVLSQRAREARAGNAIAYIKNTDTDTFVARIINSEYILT